MAPEDACSADMLVLIRWQGRTMAVPLSQLAAILLTLTTRPPKPSPPGITGWRKATVSELHTPAESSQFTTEKTRIVLGTNGSLGLKVQLPQPHRVEQASSLIPKHPNLVHK